MAQVRLTTKGILLVSLIMILFSFALGFGVWKVNGLPNLSPTDSSASESCGSNKTKGDCNGCSPVKPNGTSYKCVWANNKCKDGNQLCSGGGGETGGTACQKYDQGVAGITLLTTPYSCTTLGATTCQKNEKGENTGYKCECKETSPNGTQCRKENHCTTLDLKNCKPSEEGQSPLKFGCNLYFVHNKANGEVVLGGDNKPVSCDPAKFQVNPSTECKKGSGLSLCGCSKTGNCLTSSTPTTFVKYTCENASLSDEGIVKNGCNTGGVASANTTKMCGSIGAGKCGWVQIDTATGCFASWYFPCEEGGGGETNKCDGGGILNGATETAEVGQTRTIRGYAHDVDGVGTVTILKNNVVVGTANVTDACSMPSDTQATQLCNQYPNSKIVIWTYSYVVTEGTAIYKGVWKDSKGLGGASCEANKTITGTTVVVQDEWEVSKNAGFVCINRDTVSAQVRIDYTITVTNSANVNKNITRIVDTLDADIDPTWIMTSTINPGATVTGRVITWNLTGDAAIFTPGQTKLYRYSVMLPIGVGGSYDNVAVVTPETGDDITVETTIFATCDIPDTAIFDSTISRVVLGIMLLAIGIAYLYYEPFSRMINYGFNSVFPTKLDKVDINRRKFERKVVKQ